MRNTSKFLILILISLISCVFILTSKIKVSTAADAIPDPIVPCLEDEFEDPEFNSQRPYQASPCGDSVKAAFCNNDYIIEEKVSTTYGPGCRDVSGGYVCSVNKPPINRDYLINLKNAQLPILGNTQNVTNSHNPTDEFDDAQKMNEYLAWYLGGVNQKAEYGEDTTDKVVNFSGPAKKLLPSVIQEFQRFYVLHEAGVKDEKYTDSEGFVNPNLDTNNSLPGVQVEETSNHNQIVVCTKKSTDVNLLGLSFTIPFIGPERPIPCYEGVDNKAQGKQYRLVQWWEGKISAFNTIFNILVGWTGNTAWNSTVPPFPWQFEKDIYYQKAYQEWRGKQCNIILEKLVCFDVPGVATNVWADFYQYIPLGNTTDKNAKHPTGGVQVHTQQDPDGTIAHLESEGVVEQEPNLFYPHTKSTYDELKILNTTHTPLDTGEKAVFNDYEPESCEIVDVRSNPGDDLTFGQEVIEDKQRIYITGVSIKVDQIKCGNNGEIEHFNTDCGGIVDIIPPIDPKCDKRPSCDGSILVTIPTTPKIPFAQEIYENSVIGANSAFRNIFPKIEEGAPVSCIADIPGVSDVDYAPGDKTNLVSIDTPAGRVSPGDAKLYFPHLGSVYEYFLKGIQTALRPKGFGETITNGQLCSNLICGELPDTLPKATGSCSVGAVSPRVGSIPNALRDIVSAAAETYKVPPNLILAIMFGEGAFNTSAGGKYTKYDWTDENVKNWATCVPLPGCTGPQTSIVSGLALNWTEHSNQVIDELQIIDPTKKVADACNLIDEIYVIANMLHGAAGAGNDLAGHTCYGIEMKSSDPQSCTWEPFQFETAIRVYQYGSNWTPSSTTADLSCPYANGCHCATRATYTDPVTGTTVSGCGAGGYEKTACQVEDTCETVGGSTHTSHNACVYDVGHGR